MRQRARPNRQPGRGNHQPSNPPSSSTPRPSPPHRPSAHNAPPAHAAITLGTPVAIVLKCDQPTGRTVAGFVAEVLTRGDHPRGVKVRLRDGRVGRVQGLVGEEEGRRGEEGVGGAEAGLGRNGERGGGRGRGRGRGFRHVRDVRGEDEYLYDGGGRARDMSGYFAALEEADKRHEESRGWGGEVEERVQMESAKAVCPVCGVFEGDERAVARHVDEHFGETA